MTCRNRVKVHRATREAGNYDIWFIGTDANGNRLEASVGGDLDPGYASTSRMIGESAVCLITDCPICRAVCTPRPRLWA